MKKTYRKITYSTNWRDIPIDELVKIQAILDKKPSMTIAECGVWLQLSITKVRALIKENVIVAFHPFGSKIVRIDTEATKKNLKQNSQ